MKYECNLIKDLLPLYHDEACGRESKEAVEGHLAECEACRKYYNLMNSSDIVEDITYDAEREKKKNSSIKKMRRSMIAVGVIIAIIVTALICGGVFAFLVLFGELPEVYSKPSQYGQWDSFDGYSGLKIFPTEIEEQEIEAYYYQSQDTIFSPECQVFLQARYGDEAFAEEVKRLQNIKMVKGKEENLILSGIEQFVAPAYACIYAWHNCYEYALVFEERNTIVYVYLQNMEVEDLEFNPIFLPGNYGEETSGYTIYGFGIDNNQMIYE